MNTSKFCSFYSSSWVADTNKFKGYHKPDNTIVIRLEKMAFLISFKVRVVRKRSSHPEVFSEKGVLKTCSKFTGEHPCWSVISIKLLCSRLTIKIPEQRLRFHYDIITFIQSSTNNFDIMIIFQIILKWYVPLSRFASPFWNHRPSAEKELRDLAIMMSSVAFRLV